MINFLYYRFVFPSAIFKHKTIFKRKHCRLFLKDGSRPTANNPAFHIKSKALLSNFSLEMICLVHDKGGTLKVDCANCKPQIITPISDMEECKSELSVIEYILKTNKDKNDIRGRYKELVTKINLLKEEWGNIIKKEWTKINLSFSDRSVYRASGDNVTYIRDL